MKTFIQKFIGLTIVIFVSCIFAQEKKSVAHLVCLRAYRYATTISQKDTLKVTQEKAIYNESNEINPRPIILAKNSFLDLNSGELSFKYSGNIFSFGYDKRFASLLEHDEDMTEILDNNIGFRWYTEHENLGLLMKNLGAQNLIINWKYAYFITSRGEQNAIYGALEAVRHSRITGMEIGGNMILSGWNHFGYWSGSLFNTTVAPKDFYSDAIIFADDAKFTSKIPKLPFQILLSVVVNEDTLKYIFEFGKP